MESPNYVQMYVEAQQAGRQMARQHAVENALAKVNQDPQAAQDELMRAGAFQEAGQIGQLQQQRKDQQLRAQVAPQIKSGDYEGAASNAAAGGDFELAKTLKGLGEDHLKVLESHNQKLGAIAHYLSTVQDPQQRQALWSQTAPHLVQQGILKPEEVGSVDLSDNGLHSYEAQAIDIKTQIQNEFKARQSQMEADKFAETKSHNRATEGETARHNRADEGLSGGRLAVEQGNLAERRKEGVMTSGAGKWEPIP